MAEKRRQSERQSPLFVASSALSAAPGHSFFRELNRLFEAAGFDRCAAERCARFYVAGVGRPPVPAGVYIRMLMVGYFEGIGTERSIAWRCTDSRSLAEFLGYGPGETTPDHTTLSKMRQRLDLDCHTEVLGWAVALLADKGLVKGQCLGIDSSTLEANAAMRSLVHRETGQSGHGTFKHPHPAPPHPKPLPHPDHDLLPRVAPHPTPPSLRSPPVPLPPAPRRHAPTARTTNPVVPSRLAFPAAR